MMKALFSHAVWGEEYVSNFLRFSLPTQLSNGNLGAFGKDSVFLIATLDENIKIFEESDSISNLKKFMTVEYDAVNRRRMDMVWFKTGTKKPNIK